MQTLKYARKANDTMNQIYLPRSFSLRCATVFLSFGFLWASAFAYPGQNSAPDASCSVSPSAPFADLNIRVIDPTGALVDRAEIEVRCGSTVITGITGNDGTATIHLRKGSYSLSSSAPGFSKKTVEVHIPLDAPLSVTMDVGSATDTVNISGDSGFVPYGSNAGSKTNALLMEVPQSISIVSEQEMEARTDLLGAA